MDDFGVNCILVSVVVDKFAEFVMELWCARIE